MKNLVFLKKNILIKIGGSLLAPKDSQKKDFNVIKFLSEIIKKNPDKNFFIINGSGNVGHDFVKNNVLNSCNIKILQDNLNDFFLDIDNEFIKNGINPVFLKRFETNKVYLDKNRFFNLKNFMDHKINILGGDILNNGKIISSDKIFGDFIDFFEKNNISFSGYFSGDTMGVYDCSGNTISNISISNDILDLQFEPKKGDVTGGMKNKFLELSGKKFDEIVIFDGSLFENWINIFIKNITNGATIFKK